MASKKTMKTKKVDKSTNAVHKSGVIKSAKAQTKKVTGNRRNMAKAKDTTVSRPSGEFRVSSGFGYRQAPTEGASTKRRSNGVKTRPKKMTSGSRHARVYINKNAK